ncbi:alkaline-phosphatase-like protein [Pelagophyceae sp. CCMP2097]|nr:alkaline-phosphatase-like protein [Pelagophyceae sp. CCMP2097]
MASRPPRARAKWLFVVACFGLRGAAAAKPNLLIFQPDDLAFLWVEAPPASTVPPKQRFNTPALDLLREEGVVFTRAYASAPMCAPSRFGVVTSRYPSRSTFAQAQTSKGAKNGDCGVTYVSVPSSKLDGDDLDNTVAWALKEAGYRTAVVGKWHLDAVCGWDCGYEAATMQAVLAGFGTADGFYVTNVDATSDFLTAMPFSHNPEWVTAKALDFIDGGEPFFLHALEVISPLATPAGTLQTAPDAGMPARADVAQRASGYGGRQRGEAIGHFWVDDMLSALRSKLERLEMLDDTFIAFVMDNGSGKGTLLEAGLRIAPAMVVRYPPLFAAGSVRSDLVSNLDLGPTLCQLGGCSSNAAFYAAKMDGKSLLEPDGDRALFGEMFHGRAIVTRDFKYIVDDASSSCQTENFDAKLYDLRVDEAELLDVSGKTAYANVEATLATALRCHLARTANGASEYPDCPMSTPPPTPPPLSPTAAASRDAAARAAPNRAVLVYAGALLVCAAAGALAAC